jgi:hypothetical protein
MNNDDQDYHEARGRVRELRGFYSHVLTYIVINAALIVLNLIVSPNDLWFYWVSIFWGIGLIFHAIDVFAIRGRYFGSDWEDRKTKEIMDKKHRKTG